VDWEEEVDEFIKSRGKKPQAAGKWEKNLQERKALYRGEPLINWPRACSSQKCEISVGEGFQPALTRYWLFPWNGDHRY